MKNTNQWSAYGLKWNPFSPDVPIEGLWVAPRVESFCKRVESQAHDGGFALVTGDPGLGKSVTMRVLLARLEGLRDVVVCTLTRPRSKIGDFYRQMGELFGVPLVMHNRWGGFRGLREKWLAHIDSTLMRPVLLVDEAQEMYPDVLSELRLLGSTQFDSRAILTVVLAGDSRLPDMFRSKELLPLGSRMRVRITHEYATREDLLSCFAHRLKEAGNPNLMTKELMETLCDHAAGNYRVLFQMAEQLLDEAVQREIRRLDEKLFLEVFAAPVVRKPPPPTARGNRRRS